MSNEIPQDLRYTKEHEWARREGDLIVVGITRHAVEQLGDITMVSLPEPGTTLTQGQGFGEVDSVKAVSELYAPLSGSVTERNESLENAPETVNESPYENGWMIKIEPSAPEQFDALMDATAYGAYLEE
jgi:glycine cleavage system H protein